MARLPERLISWSRKDELSEDDLTVENEALMSKEANELSTLYLSLQRKQQRTQRCLVASCLLLGTALVTIPVLWTQKYPSTGNIGPPSPVPSLPTTPITFERDNNYAAPSTPESDQAWGSLSPPGDGFIYISNSSSYNLPPGEQSPEGEIYDISLFHQLHCLSHIRTYAFTLKAGMMHNTTREVYDHLLRKQEDHVYHCFDYIRQAIMCAGDLTVEWPREEADGRRFAVDGWGVTHQCRSWEAIMGFMRENTVARTWQDV